MYLCVQGRYINATHLKTWYAPDEESVGGRRAESSRNQVTLPMTTYRIKLQTGIQRFREMPRTEF